MDFKKIGLGAVLAAFIFAGIGASAENAAVPSAPEFTAPANNAATTVGAEVNFKWSAATSTIGIAEYELQYFKNKVYTGNPDYSATSTAAEQKIVFAGVGDYYLRARAKDVDGVYGAWSNTSTKTFRIVVNAVGEDGDLLPIPNVLAKKAECMKGNWDREDIAGGPFKNQGECVAHWNHQIRRHVQNIVNTIQAKMQALATQVKKQNDEAVSKGYSNWGQYMKAQKANQKGNN